MLGGGNPDDAQHGAREETVIDHAHVTDVNPFVTSVLTASAFGHLFWLTTG
jgi:hypothetical protein